MKFSDDARSLVSRLMSVLDDHVRLAESTQQHEALNEVLLFLQKNLMDVRNHLTTPEHLPYPFGLWQNYFDTFLERLERLNPAEQRAVLDALRTMTRDLYSRAVQPRFTSGVQLLQQTLGPNAAPVNTALALRESQQRTSRARTERALPSASRSKYEPQLDPVIEELISNGGLRSNLIEDIAPEMRGKARGIAGFLRPDGKTWLQLATLHYAEPGVEVVEVMPANYWMHDVSYETPDSYQELIHFGLDSSYDIEEVDEDEREEMPLRLTRPVPHRMKPSHSHQRHSLVSIQRKEARLTEEEERADEESRAEDAKYERLAKEFAKAPKLQIRGKAMQIQEVLEIYAALKLRESEENDDWSLGVEPVELSSYFLQGLNAEDLDWMAVELSYYCHVNPTVARHLCDYMPDRWTLLHTELRQPDFTDWNALEANLIGHKFHEELWVPGFGIVEVRQKSGGQGSRLRVGKHDFEWTYEHGWVSGSEEPPAELMRCLLVQKVNNFKPIKRPQGAIHKTVTPQTGRRHQAVANAPSDKPVLAQQFQTTLFDALKRLLDEWEGRQEQSLHRYAQSMHRHGR